MTNQLAAMTAGIGVEANVARTTAPITTRDRGLASNGTVVGAKG